MRTIHSFRWVALIAIISLFLVTASPTSAGVAIQGASLDLNAVRWLQTADDNDTATFIVVLNDTGTKAQVANAAAIPNKLTRRERVTALLSAQAAQNDRSVRAFLKARGLQNNTSALKAYEVFNGFIITADKQTIEALKNWSEVYSIERERIYHLEELQAAETLPQINAVEWNISKIGADRVVAELGINGAGVVVGNIDTGVRHTHQDLRDNYNCPSAGPHTNCWLDAINGRTTPYDDSDHGTHTMGTVAGHNGIGVAPGTRWIACKAFDSAGNGGDQAILDCFDFFLHPGGSVANAPDVVNNSWSDDNGANTAFQQAVTNWVNAGIFPEFSNSNAGPNCNTVGAPASYTNAFGAGATDINDAIADFSSRGPSPFGVMKPDVSAPGVSIRSSVGSGDASYGSFSGTSMAGPHVTGLVALLLDANPSLTISQLTQNMKDNALPISATGCSSSGVPNNIYGWGRIRAFESVQAALGGSPTNTPTPTATLPSGTNLALNKPATASASCNTSETPPKAVNGSWTGGNSDKWCDNSSASKWLQVDLGANFNLTQFVIRHAGAGGESTSLNTSAYNLQVSTNGTSWTTVVTVTANTSNVTTNNIAATNARYVRLNVTAGTQGTSTTARIYEVEVYGASGPTSTPTNTPTRTPTPTVGPSATATFTPTSNNDLFANAASLGVSQTVSGTNQGATTESGEPTPCGSIGATLWYRLTPSANGSLTVSSAGSNFDTVLAFYSGTSLANLTNLACNDDFGGTLQSQVSVSVVGGQTYYLQVGGYSGATGNIALQSSFTPSGATATATTPPTGTNLALNKPATASASCNANEGPEKAVNGSWTGGNSDKWCDSSSASKWWQVDLGANFNVNQFVIRHAGAGGESTSLNTRDFTIQVSTDGVNWTTVVTVSGNTASVTTHDISAVTARYVRLNVTAPEQGGGGAARIYEVEVYGN